jgi:shikimate 5-dehydrogenase
MLVHQAAIAFRRWTGVEDASSVMRDALAPLLLGVQPRP